MSNCTLNTSLHAFTTVPQINKDSFSSIIKPLDDVALLSLEPTVVNHTDDNDSMVNKDIQGKYLYYVFMILIINTST